MDLQSITEPSKKTFFNHVFSGSDEGKAEILNDKAKSDFPKSEWVRRGIW